MAKKLISLMMAVVLSMSMLMLVGCNGAEKELQKQIDDLTALLTEHSNKIEEQSSKITELETSKTEQTCKIAEQENKIVELELENGVLQDKLEEIKWESKAHSAEVYNLFIFYEQLIDSYGIEDIKKENSVIKEIMRNIAHYNSLALGGDGSILEKKGGEWIVYDYIATMEKPTIDEKMKEYLKKAIYISNFDNCTNSYSLETYINYTDIKDCLGVFGEKYIILAYLPGIAGTGMIETYWVGDIGFSTDGRGLGIFVIDFSY